MFDAMLWIFGKINEYLLQKKNMKKKLIYLETLGCQMNFSDSERAATKLRSQGFDLCGSPEKADIVIINTCSIRERAEQKVFNRIGEIKKRNANRDKIIGIMGCVAQLQGATLFERVPGLNFVAGTGASSRIPNLLDEVSNIGGQVIDLKGREEVEGWDVSLADRYSKYIGFIPIIEGCNKFCTYCIVPYSRGRERSRLPIDIINSSQKLLSQGFKEIQLIGQNVNSYRPQFGIGLERFSGATAFAKLLRAVSSTGMPRVKFTTSFPRDFHRDIVTAIDENENLCNWIHLPVQSGNNRVLRRMRRGYGAGDYLKCLDFIKGARRKISLTSDIIVGFPGESAEEFEDTLRLVERCQFDGLYIFKYSERSGTPAAKLGDTVVESVKTQRFLALEQLQMSIQRKLYSAYIGTEVDVLVEGISVRSSEDIFGHTTCNKVVNFNGNKNSIGKIVRVHITEAKSNSLYGKFVGEK